MKKGRFTLIRICRIVLLVLGAYWVGYFASVRGQATDWAEFSRFVPPDYRVPSSMQAAVHYLFNPAYFVDSHFLRPAKWDAFRPPPIFQPPGSQTK
jgi:hypothetical protein